MANRFSFDEDDEASFNPHSYHDQPNTQYHSARDRQTDYQVASGSSYLPSTEPPDPLSPPPPPAPHSYDARPEPPAPLNSFLEFQAGRQRDLDENRRSDPFRDPAGPPSSRGYDPSYYNSSQGHPDNILPVPSPPPASYRDPHANSYPIPPPHRRNSSFDQNDTAYHGAAGSDYDYEPYGHHGYSDYPPASYDRGRSPEPHSHLAAPAAGAGLGAGALGSSLTPGSSARPSPERYSSHGLGAWQNDSWADLGSIDPRDIADEEDESNPLQDSSKGKKGVFGGGAAGGAIAGGGGILMRPRDANGQYGQVPGSGAAANDTEKSSWLKQQTTGSKKMKWMVGGLILLVIILAIIGGVVGVLLTQKKGSNPSAPADSSGDLNKDSPQIKSLMNNPGLHKVFQGMDYTSINSQYPACIQSPPSQNNVTMDVAVLSQLTPEIRLYGTDCNQTAMVLHSIKALDLTSSMKLWLGVFLGSDDSVNDRQIKQLYDILDDSATPRNVLAGAIVGNELLYEKTFPPEKLTAIMTDVKHNLTSRGINIPVSTSDLGDNWTKAPQMLQTSDIIMSNIHPFFAGTPATEAAGWTYSFWSNNDLKLTANNPSKKQIISEVGWPSESGNDCGIDPNSAKNVPCPNPTAGAVSGVNEMNEFMSTFVCQANGNNTGYFWFEAFDEPWKVQFDTPNSGLPPVEDHWGLMDVNRVLKPGIQIPDCGGAQAKGASAL